MKFAVIGTGRTGGKVVELLGNRHDVLIFNEKNPPTAKAIQPADACIIFIPGDAVEAIFPVVLESRIPAVWGSTGFEWTEEIAEKVFAAGVPWLVSSNFSLGMQLVRRCIRLLSKGSTGLPNAEFFMHEIHHIHKKDAPSGTALSWAKWLDKPVEITHERVGEVFGVHELELRTSMESVFLRHEAHDRAVFAEGAIWAAMQLVQTESEPGIHDFSTIFDNVFNLHQHE